MIVGAPDDSGVAIVGGRPGAKDGPAAIRRELGKKSGYKDAGDIEIQNSQEKTYQILREKIRILHEEKNFPIILGGGHDLSFGSLSGFLDVYPHGGIINIDPHLDARPILKEGEYSSGSAYRLLLEKRQLEGKRLMEFGYQPHCNGSEPLQFLQRKGVQLVAWPADFEKKLLPFAESLPALAISFDMDCIHSDFAPGVSAPAKIGYTADEALALIRAIKTLPNLQHFEIMETNPKFDMDGKTAKLAAQLVCEICK